MRIRDDSALFQLYLDAIYAMGKLDEILLGEEAKGYSISEELDVRIEKEVTRTMPIRGTRVVFFDSKYDNTLYQRFLSPDGQNIRVL